MYTMFGQADWFLICGLGNLGQHCVVALKEFEVGVIAIEQTQPQNWEIANIPDLVDHLIFGDCRHHRVLGQAKIGQCRAALLLAPNEQTNIETALAIRQLNPQIRLVIRSAKTNLNRLLSQQLGNFIAYDPTELPAMAFTLAALGTTTLGLFNLEQQRLHIVQCQVGVDFPGINLRHLYELNSPTRRLLAHAPDRIQLPTALHQWEQSAPLELGDWLVYIEIVEIDWAKPTLGEQVYPLAQQSPHLARATRTRSQNVESIFSRYWQGWQQHLAQFWQQGWRSQIRRVAILYGITVLGLLLIGTLLFQQYYPQISFEAAFFDTAILLLGGYGDLFGSFQQSEPIPGWLRLFALGLTITGTAFVGVLYAILTETLLSSKFEFIKHRPPVPIQEHIIIIGLGRIGQRVATMLQDLHQPLVGVALGTEVNATFLPDLPLVTSDLNTALVQANCSTAKSVVIITADEILNLELALMIQAIDPHRPLVLRTAGQRLRELLPQLLPQAQILDVCTVAAEAFAGAAFGQNIIHLFRYSDQTILVTEYQINEIDTLNGLLLADVTYGYGAMPILYQQPPAPARLLPDQHLRLSIGDRLILMTTIDGLRRIEQGRISIKPKNWQIRVELATTKQAAIQGANAIALATGYPVDTVWNSMLTLPATLPILLYKHQVQDLVRQLSQLQVQACSIEISNN
jgi:voltage-gated potassium channel Kch